MIYVGEPTVAVAALSGVSDEYRRCHTMISFEKGRMEGEEEKETGGVT